MNRRQFMARLCGTPIAMHPKYAADVVASLTDMRDLQSGPKGAAMYFGEDDDADYARARRRSELGYELLPGGVAHVAVQGTLFQRVPWLGCYFGLSGYSGIRQGFMGALADDEVSSIMLDVDSGGGEVAGCFDLVDTIYEARGSKPIWAVLNESAYSAAYAIASAADRIILPRTGGVGSIGIIELHVDVSQALEKAGLNVTIIKKGERKSDGYPEIPLSPEAVAAIQEKIDFMGDLFDQTVARNRKLTPAKVAGMEAGLFTGVKAVEAGLADAVMSPDAAFRDLVAATA